ncbi:MAG: histidine kinase [Caldilineaceae bacterium]
MSVGMLPPAVLDLGLRSYLQEAVHDSESTLHNIVENTIDGLVVVDPEGYIVMWNPGQERITGVMAAEALGMPIWDMVWALTPAPRRDAAYHTDLCRNLQRTLQVVDGDTFTRAYELEIARPSGELRIVQQFAFALSYDQGESRNRRLGWIFHDVTEFRQVAIKLLRRDAELSLLHRINGVLASSADLEQLRKAILGEVLQLQQAAAVSIWLADETTGDLTCVQSLDQTGGPALATSLARWQSIVQHVAVNGQFLVETDLCAAAHSLDAGRCPSIAPQMGGRALVGVPIKFRDKVLGALLLVHEHPPCISAAASNVLESIATAAGAAFENVRLYEKAQELALLQERQRLAADLHDAINQSLFSAGLIADSLPLLIERDPAEAAACLQNLRLLLHGAAADLRAVLAELQPSLICRADFGDLLTNLAAGYTGRTSTTVAVKIGARMTFAPGTQAALYRLCREAIANIAKHANATQVWVELAQKPGGIQILIRDNGRGMEPGCVPSGHFGLLLMQQQAAEAGAEFHIASEIGHGTEIAVFIPDLNR